MRALRWARRNAAAIVLPLAGLSCRSADGPTGTGRIAPSFAALAVQPVLSTSPEDPVIPLREARIRLFRLPGRTPEVSVLDTLVPFLETDNDREVTLGVTLTMANERFGVELALLDDQRNVVYLGRDTVIAYTSGKPPAAKPLRLRYAGPDTAVARIALAPSDTVLAIGDALPLRVAAFLRDGRATTARVGFAVHGSAAVSVDASGLVRALTPVAAGSVWVVARTVTGLVDSASVAAIVPARTITLSPDGGRLTVGSTIGLAAVLRDSAGAPIAGREPTWRSSDLRVATVAGGKVTGVGVGTAEITATSERASAAAVVTVLPGGVARVTIAPRTASLRIGEAITLTATASDALGNLVPTAQITWRALAPVVASVDASGQVRALSTGHTQLVASVDGVSDSILVDVRP
jgi:uncharacterized protein YjdB